MIVVGGENLVDYVQISNKEDLPVYKAIPGGSCYNVAIAAARQGQKVSYITPISNDSLGNILASRLEADGVKVCAPRVQEPTSLAVVSLNDSQPSYQFYRTETAERKITRQMLNEINPTSIKIFHIGSISLIDGEDADIWEQRFGELAEQGVVTSLDPNIRQLLIKNQSEYLARLKRMIKYAHILKLSDEDLKYIYSEKSVDDAFDEICRGTDAKIVVLTMGEKGARVKTGEFSFELGRNLVISGWELGLKNMKIGGKRCLVIPPNLAYGARRIDDIIPANSTLIFEIELVNIENKKES